MAAILMTDADKERWKAPLMEFFEAKGLVKDEIIVKIDEIFAQAQIGWNRAPRDIGTRIKVKSGFQCKSHENLKPRQKQIDEPSLSDPEESGIDDTLFGSMTKAERKWWENRFKEYFGDFDFNDSSDKPLLEQLIVEELIQKRLFKLQLKYQDKDYSKRLSDSLKRIADTQTKLGITREQRAGILNKIDGNVAQIALNLNEKLEVMPEKIKQQYEEELRFTNLKKQKPPINILPPIDKVEALLNIEGKVTANLDSDHISAITESVAKEITETREAMKQAPPKRELADGVDVS